MPETVVPVFAILIIFGAPIAWAITNRVLAHQERMEYLRRGMIPPDPRLARTMSRQGWQAGPIPPPPGPGMGVPPPPVMPMYQDDVSAQTQMRKGVTVTMVGFALLIGLSFIRPGYPGPWLLGGLIPMFVGIAQIINAVINGARFPGMQAMQMGGPQQYQAGPSPTPPPAGPATSAAPPSSGPYAWRPGPTPEIEKKD